MIKSLTVLKSSIAIPVNGAERSMFERLSMLRQSGWNSKIICFIESSKTDSYLKVLKNLGITAEIKPDHISYFYKDTEVQAWLENMPLEPVTDYESFSARADQILRVESDSLLICNMRDAAALYYCSISKRPAVFFMTENEFPRPQQLPGQDHISRAYSTAKNVVVASNFLKESLFQSWGIHARVFSNAINVDHYAVSKNDNPDLITIFHPYAHKGIEVFLKIVASLPEYKFLTMGGTGQEYRNRKQHLLSYPNLKLLPYIEDIREVLAASRLVLIPSIWEEAFSRVVIESLSSGTPVIAFDRGGIREAGCNAIKYIPFSDNYLSDESINLWKAAITEILEPETYINKVEESKLRVSQFKIQLKHDIQEMSEWFENLLTP